MKWLMLMGCAALLAAPTLWAQETTEIKATAAMQPTPGNTAKGKVTFTQTAAGVRIEAEITGLTPGPHGFHIHEKGDCSGNATAAGGHFADNPSDRHGGPESTERHLGDLGNIIADASGRATYDRVDRVISLTGTNSILGRAIIVHEKSDDLRTQPTGDSGSRIACGVIQAAQP